MRTTISMLYVYVVVFGVIFCIAYFLWRAERTINYKFSYQAHVEKTVRDMVKAECLKVK